MQIVENSSFNGGGGREFFNKDVCSLKIKLLLLDEFVCCNQGLRNIF